MRSPESTVSKLETRIYPNARWKAAWPSIPAWIAGIVMAIWGVVTEFDSRGFDDMDRMPWWFTGGVLICVAGNVMYDLRRNGLPCPTCGARPLERWDGINSVHLTCTSCRVRWDTKTGRG